MWLFLFICFVLGPSSSQLSAWLSGGGSLPQYIWILRLLLFGYESWILFAFPSGDAGCQLLWLQYIVARRDTLRDKFDQWDLFLLSVFLSLSLSLTDAALVGTASFTLQLCMNKPCVKSRVGCKVGCVGRMEGSSARLSRLNFQGFSFYFFHFTIPHLKKTT